MVMEITTMKEVNYLYFYCLSSMSIHQAYFLSGLSFFNLVVNFFALVCFLLLFYYENCSSSSGEFVVHKVGPGTRSFQSAVTDKFICVTSDEINCKVDID